MTLDTKSEIEIKLNMYETYRRYIIHQDNILNNRMTWLLTIHGFLYATYGLTLQKKLEVAEKIRESKTPLGNIFDSIIGQPPSQMQLEGIQHRIDYFLNTIAAVGISISLLALFLLMVAGAAARSVGEIGNESFAAMMETSNDGNSREKFHVYRNYYLPALAGGGDKSLPDIGRKLQWLIPGTLIASWLISFLALAGVI